MTATSRRSAQHGSKAPVVAVRPISLGKHAPAKGGPLQTLQTALYARAVAPEILGVHTARAVQGSIGTAACPSGRPIAQTHAPTAYTLTLGLMPGGHCIAFEVGELVLTEIVTEHEHALPPDPLAGCLCAGDNEAEHRTPDGRINWMTSVQTEHLPDHLFTETMAEMEEVIREGYTLVHRWNDSTGECLSLLSLQRFPREAQLEAYHLMASGGLILRTQSVFEILPV